MAQKGLILSSTRHATVEIYGGRIRANYLQIDDGNNVLNADTYIHRCIYNAGDDPRCDYSIGINIMAVNLPSLTRATGNIIDVTGGRHGIGMRIGDIDSSYFNRVNAGVRSDDRQPPEPVTGTGIVFDYDVVNCPGGGESHQRIRYARKNCIAYVNGKILAKTGTKNWIGLINSEPSEVVIEPGASLHYSAIDSINGMRFQTARLKMSDNFRFSANDFEAAIGSPVKRFAAGRTFNSWKFEKALDSGISTTLRLSDDISQGRIPSVEILFIQKDHALGNIHFESTIRTCKLAEPIAGGKHINSLVHAASGKVNQLQSAIVEINPSDLIFHDTIIVDLIIARKALPGPDGSVIILNLIFLLFPFRCYFILMVQQDTRIDPGLFLIEKLRILK